MATINMQVFQGVLTALFYLYYVKWKVIISFCSGYATNNMEKKQTFQRQKPQKVWKGKK